MQILSGFMKNNIIFSFILLMFYSLSVQANVETQAGWHELSIQHDGKARFFRYFIPSHLVSNPDVVLLFHGGTQSMRKIFRRRAGGTQEWEYLAERDGFLLLAPNGVNIKTGDTEGNKQSWNDCRIAVEGNNSASTEDDVGFVSKLLHWAKTHFFINESRVYATGASNGGMMTLRVVTELGKKIAAAAVFIANQPVQTDCKHPETPVPLFMMTATKDPLILWQGGKIFGKGPVLMSAQATLEYWLKVNRADEKRLMSKRLPGSGGEDSFIIKNIYPAKPDGKPVWFYEVHGAGHTMPSIKHNVPFMARLLVGKQNKDLEASHEAWNFLKQFER